MKKVTIQYGIDLIEKNVPETTTVGQLVSDPNIRAALGYGDNIKALLNGLEMPNGAIVPGEARLIVETRANTKAIVF